MSAAREARAASQVCSYYGIKLKKLTYKGLGRWSEGFIPARNALLLLSGLMACPFPAAILAIGIHSGTQYSDCSPMFLRAMQDLLDIYTNGRVRIVAPFLTWNKRQIWDYCNKQQVPLDLTYSCEAGRDQPCGSCRSCRDLETLRAIGS